MNLIKKYLNRVFIDGLSGMALGLFATLIIGTIIQQIGTLAGGSIGALIYAVGKVAAGLVASIICKSSCNALCIFLLLYLTIVLQHFHCLKYTSFLKTLQPFSYCNTHQRFSVRSALPLRFRNRIPLRSR